MWLYRKSLFLELIVCALPISLLYIAFFPLGGIAQQIIEGPQSALTGNDLLVAIYAVFGLWGLVALWYCGFKASFSNERPAKFKLFYRLGLYIGICLSALCVSFFFRDYGNFFGTVLCMPLIPAIHLLALMHWLPSNQPLKRDEETAGVSE